MGMDLHFFYSRYIWLQYYMTHKFVATNYTELYTKSRWLVMIIEKKRDLLFTLPLWICDL